jgi:PAS domain-containing protein
VCVHVGGDGALGTPDGRFPDVLELAATLDALPLASLVLAADGSALAVNKEWALLFAAPGRPSAGAGWLDAVEPEDREPLWRLLAGAVADGIPGSADFRLTDSGGGRPCRWWWRSLAPGQLIVCVADLDVAMTSARATPPGLAVGESAGVAIGLVHRMFGVGLLLESAAGLADGPVRDRLLRAVGELDAVIRDIRTAVFAAQVRLGISRAGPGDDRNGA